MRSKRRIKVALAGNPNSGKTTLFNALTGSHQHVGNWPGVTVEKKEGTYWYQDHEVTVVDLPGTYGLTAYSLDERIAHNYLIDERPDAVVAVVDATSLERSLYLVIQLLELGARVILVLNMLDVARSQGLDIDLNGLARILGVRVVPAVASLGVGVEELRQILHDIGKQVHAQAQVFSVNYGADIENEIEQLVRSLAKVGLVPNLPVRWLALRLLEGDTEERHHIESSPQGAEIIRQVDMARTRLRSRLQGDVETLIVERRYGFAGGLVKECVRQRLDLVRRLTVSDRIDRVLTSRWLGVPLFLILMALAFQLVFRVGTPLARLMDGGFEALSRAAGLGLDALRAPDWLGSLLADGLIGGIGSVLVFLPNIALLFLVISILEDSGYMARAAFVMDRFMHALGLHGKSFIPLMMGFGCCVPAVLATRTLESRKDRILTILIVPLMSCTARLPTYTLFAAAFFPKHQALVVFSLYVLGVILAVVVARVFRGLLFREEVTPLVIELPPYHAPVMRHLLRHVAFRSWLFVRKAGTIIAGAVLVLWLLARLPWGVAYASGASFLGRIGGLLAPVFAPAGFGYWQVAVALLAGVVAKELVVGTLGALSQDPGGLAGSLSRQFSPVSAYAFMAMTLIYVPCVATVAAIQREAGWRWAALAVGYSLVLGWGVAVLINQVGQLLIA